jgi:hypothetical protein
MGNTFSASLSLALLPDFHRLVHHKAAKIDGFHGQHGPRVKKEASAK